MLVSHRAAEIAEFIFCITERYGGEVFNLENSEMFTTTALRTRRLNEMRRVSGDRREPRGRHISWSYK